ncbi:MAG: endo alpha-1,4 polygalactosaminidase [Ilumatobacteraceae bacterium]
MSCVTRLFVGGLFLLPSVLLQFTPVSSAETVGAATAAVPATRLMNARVANPPPDVPNPVMLGPVASLTPGTSWQWQLTGTVDETVLDGVVNPNKMYDIDMFAASASTIGRLHAKGIYVVCYLETGGWESYRQDAGAFPIGVLGSTVGGYPQERYVDIRQLDVLLPIIAARLDSARSKGCDGIEPDLDDSYTSPTGFPLTMQHQLTYNRAVADLAHARNLSIGLKNGASEGGVFEAASAQFTDWALNEECHQYGECGGYSTFIEMNKAVFQVEYTGSGTTAAEVCPANNAAGYDGLLKQSSRTLAALPRISCRLD